MIHRVAFATQNIAFSMKHEFAKYILLWCVTHFSFVGNRYVSKEHSSSLHNTSASALTTEATGSSETSVYVQ